MTNQVRILIQFSFMAVTMCFFTAQGHTLGIYIAASVYSNAANFVERGGSIETGTLNGYYFLIGFITVLGFLTGITSGRGFYLAWKALAIKG